MRKVCCFALAIYAVIGLAGSAGAQDLADARSRADLTKAVQTCVLCHGPNGRSVSPTFPNLAAQSAEYLKVQLKAGWPQGVPQLKTGPFYADDVGRLALGAIERLIESLESVKIVTDAFPGSEQVEQVTETKENPSE